MKSIFSLFVLLLLFQTLLSFEDCSITPSTDLPTFIMIPTIYSESFQVIELDPSTGSKCLDGTNFKFLFSPGSGSGINKFMFNWLGGAFCGIDGYDTLESCYLRSKSGLGSSNTWGSNNSIVQETNALGYFSSDHLTNPMFWNWNKVIIKYCDGSNHQGYSEKPYVFNGVNLWFRGYNNTLSTFEHLRKNLKLFEASEIIVSGGSAGGQATYMWTSFLQDYFPKSIKFMAIPDAGLFLDVYNNQSHCYLYRYLNQKVANLTNSNQLDLFRKCKYLDEIWKCMLPEYILGDIDVPMFIINSQQDSEAMRTQFGVSCVPNPEKCTQIEKDQIAIFRQKFVDIINQIRQNKKNWGFWLRTCFEHVYQSTNGWYKETYNVYNLDLGDWYNLKFAIGYWYNNGILRETNDSAFIDILDWEKNPYCWGIKNENSLDRFFRILLYLGFGLIAYAIFISKLSECLFPKKTQSFFVE